MPFLLWLSLFGVEQISYSGNLIWFPLASMETASCLHFFWGDWFLPEKSLLMLFACDFLLYFLARICNQMGCNACKSLSIYLLFNPFWYRNSNGIGFRNFGAWIFSQLCPCKFGINFLESGELVRCDIESIQRAAAAAYSSGWCWKSKEICTLGRIPPVGPSMGLKYSCLQLKAQKIVFLSLVLAAGINICSCSSFSVS